MKQTAKRAKPIWAEQPQLFQDIFGTLDRKVLADTEALYAARLTNGAARSSRRPLTHDAGFWRWSVRVPPIENLRSFLSFVTCVPLGRRSHLNMMSCPHPASQQ